MNIYSDQAIAKRMLQIRERGYSFGLFYRLSAKRYLLLVACYAVALVFLAFAEIWTGFCIVLGMLCGAFLRDIGWVQAIKRTWPFSVKVTDWEKVQKLADEPAKD